MRQAALKLAESFKVRSPANAKGRADLVMDVMFDQAPDWTRKPTFDQLMATYPAAAGKDGKAGRAMIKCTIDVQGVLRNCSVVSEMPEGLGFGGAALALAPTFLMKPGIRQGKPVATEISIPINFKINAPMTGAGYSSVKVMQSANWSKAPTTPEILAALDRNVRDKALAGKVTVQCGIAKKSGRLEACVTSNVSPKDAGFESATRALFSKFAVDPQVLSDIKDEIKINLVFNFPEQSSPIWKSRFLTHATWLQTVAPHQGAIFPAEAAKAGLKKGSSTVECVVAPGGALTNCIVFSESVPNMGFGTMALKLAQSFVANPWGDDGLPTEGAHVRLPINLVQDETPPPTPAATQ